MCFIGAETAIMACWSRITNRKSEKGIGRCLFLCLFLCFLGEWMRIYKAIIFRAGLCVESDRER